MRGLLVHDAWCLAHVKMNVSEALLELPCQYLSPVHDLADGPRQGARGRRRRRRRGDVAPLCSLCSRWCVRCYGHHWCVPCSCGVCSTLGGGRRGRRERRLLEPTEGDQEGRRAESDRGDEPGLCEAGDAGVDVRQQIA